MPRILFLKPQTKTWQKEKGKVLNLIGRPVNFNREAQDPESILNSFKYSFPQSNNRHPSYSQYLVPIRMTP